uniref:Uncharacterized protein n=1 Tax=Myripristis murdjan TaxID=586833 RepID=A0A667YKV2_9TELE
YLSVRDSTLSYTETAPPHYPSPPHITPRDYTGELLLHYYYCMGTYTNLIVDNVANQRPPMFLFYLGLMTEMSLSHKRKMFFI